VGNVLLTVVEVGLLGQGFADGGEGAVAAQDEVARRANVAGGPKQTKVPTKKASLNLRRKVCHGAVDVQRGQLVFEVVFQVGISLPGCKESPIE